MKTIQTIYDRYQIMPQLQLHQLRVAAVAALICERFGKPVDAESITLACLFHDMGNIIKSDFSRFPEFLQPKGLTYWQGVKDEFIAKYGMDEHDATEAIAQELLPQGAIEVLLRIGFRNAKKNDADSALEYKIANYSDMRVGPYGVMSMEERVEEGRKRYAGRKHPVSDLLGDEFESYVKALKNIEQGIFADTDLVPVDITDAAIAPLMEKLRVKGL